MSGSDHTTTGATRPPESPRQREMMFFMQLGASCIARADQYGKSLGALGLRQLAQSYLRIAAGFAGDEESTVPGQAHPGRALAEAPSPPAAEQQCSAA